MNTFGFRDNMQPEQSNIFSKMPYDQMNIFLLQENSINAYFEYFNVFDNINLNDLQVRLSLDHLLDLDPFRSNIFDDISGKNTNVASDEKIIGIIKRSSSIDSQSDTLFSSASDISDFSLFSYGDLNLNPFLVDPFSNLKYDNPVTFEDPSKIVTQPINDVPCTDIRESSALVQNVGNINMITQPRAQLISSSEIKFDKNELTKIQNQTSRYRSNNKSYNSVGKPRHREMDPESIAKREKHNEMEKVRRRLVSQAFNILAQILLIDCTKKTSKALILQAARDRVLSLNKIYDDLKKLTEAAHEKRKIMVHRIERILSLSHFN